MFDWDIWPQDVVAGDEVVCIHYQPPRCFCRPTPLVVGDTYVIAAVLPCPCERCDLVLFRIQGMPQHATCLTCRLVGRDEWGDVGYPAPFFRKVEKSVTLAEVDQRIRACKPVRELEPA
jgi:hypothetical protein